MPSLDQIAVVGDLLVLPSAIAVALPLYWKWWRDMRASKLIQTIALAVFVCVAGVDAIDRVGILWPSRSEVAARRDALETKVADQAKIIDNLRARTEASETKVADQVKIINNLQAKIEASHAAPNVATTQSVPANGAFEFHGDALDHSHIKLGTIISTGGGVVINGNVKSSSVEAERIESGVPPSEMPKPQR